MMKRILYVMVAVAVLLPYGTFADPPFMWYATYSVEDYDGNGNCGKNNLWGSHEDAEGFAKAVNARNLPNTVQRYNRRDTECTAIRWSYGSAESNYVDFLFYAGHGCGKGPIFGCNPGYPITNWERIRFGGNGYLKWVQAAACTWFVKDSLDRCHSGKNEFERWDPCFKGVHTIQGHRAVTWDHEFSDEMNEQFWVDWCSYGYTIYWSWRHAQIYWVYEQAGVQGLVPATAAQSKDFGQELFSQATDDPAPDGMGWLAWAQVGYPLY